MTWSRDKANEILRPEGLALIGHGDPQPLGGGRFRVRVARGARGVGPRTVVLRVSEGGVWSMERDRPS